MFGTDESKTVCDYSDVDERRADYNWFSRHPAPVLARHYPAWLAKHGLAK